MAKEDIVYLYTISFVRIHKRMDIVVLFAVVAMLIGQLLRVPTSLLIETLVVLYVLTMVLVRKQHARRSDERPYATVITFTHVMFVMSSAGAATVVAWQLPEGVSANMWWWILWGGFSIFLVLISLTDRGKVRLHPI